MGKIRTKTIGDENTEQEQQKKRKVEREQKKSASNAANAKEKPADSDGTKDTKGTEGTNEEAKVTKEESGEKKQKKAKFVKGSNRSKRYNELAGAVDKKKVYPLKDALALLPTLSKAKFDETVELHINTTETGVNTTITLPHGTGKTVRVAIADDAVIAEVAAGKINFDILLAQPQMMPKLAKVAKILGPKGLMPNPKNGTITNDPQKAAAGYAKGKMTVKTEAKSPIMHTSVGKVSFGTEKLSENVKALIAALPKEKIKNITLKSTMSPGIKISL